MIEAEMYGMIPSAKIVRRRRFPPENRSRKPRMPPPCCRKNDSSAWKLIPGTGMWPPTRYTASMMNVNRTRLRRSGMLKMFLIESNIASLSSAARRGGGDDLRPAAGTRDLLGGALAELVCLHHERAGQLAVPQHLDAGIQALDEPLRQERLRCDLPLESGQRGHIDDRELLLEQVREAALRDAPVQRHLAALEPEVLLPARARQLPLVPGRRRLAVSRAGAPSYSLRLLAGPPGGTEGRQIQLTRHPGPPRCAPS